MEPDCVPVLLVTGTVGSGKTAVAKEIGERLRLAAVPHAVIDLDELGRVRPALPDGSFNHDLIAANLAAIWPNYQALGVERVVLARILESREELDDYRRAVPGADITVCRLVADHDVIGGRLRAREPGHVREFLLEVSTDLDAKMGDLALEDFTLENGADRAIGELAQAILVECGWSA
jgi:predicted kinase